MNWGMTVLQTVALPLGDGSEAATSSTASGRVKSALCGHAPCAAALDERCLEITGFADLRGIGDAGSPGMLGAVLGRMNIVTWLVVGLVAGVLAGMLVGGYGLVADMVVGMIGAYVGGYLFAHEGWHAPMDGLGGSIFVAFIGAVILLVVLRLVRTVTAGSRRV